LIAKRAGVSAVTVSRVLNGKIKGSRPGSAQRIAEIHRIADELGYRPNISARNMANGRFNSIGLIRGTNDCTSHDFGGRLTWHIEQTLSRRGFGVLIGTMDDRQLDDVAYVPQLLRELSSDGLIINYTHNLPRHMATLIDEHRLPVVWPNSKRRFNSVYPDDLNAGRRATELLLRMGHQRIAYASTEAVPFSEPHYSKVDRLAGYQAAMAGAGFSPRNITLPQQWQLAAPRLEQLLTASTPGDRPTAIVGYSFFEGATAMLAGMRAGLRVPRDLSVVGIGSYEPSAVGIAMTMLEIPVREMGEAAAQMLVDRIANPTASVPSVSLPFSLFEGDTVGPLPLAPEAPAGMAR
jgi:LacI family transcriptional regulator